MLKNKSHHIIKQLDCNKHVFVQRNEETVARNKMKA